MHKNILIIGAGLTGLLLAYKLKQQGIPVTILEARKRLGGRIYTHLSDQETPIEMGATWLGEQHTALLELLKELNIPIYPQYTQGTAWYEPTPNQKPQEVTLSQNESPSYRIQGGSSSVIEQLAKGIDTKEIHFNSAVTHIKATEETIEVTTKDQIYTASKVISTLPPNLLVSTITFSPALPNSFSTIAQKTHTWMGESIKFGVSYPTSFWKHHDWSGTLYSNIGPITEMYDHTTLEKGTYALKGFLSNEMASVTKEVRKEKVLAQLKRIFGEEATAYLNYEETIWKEQPYTFTSYKSFVFPHQNNGHAIYREALYNDRFYVAGSETASSYGGYMEGAVRSVYSCFEYILKDTL